MVNWLEDTVQAYFTACSLCEHVLIPVRTNVSALIADAFYSAGETRAEKFVCSPQAKQTLVGEERLRDEPKERLPRGHSSSYSAFVSNLASLCGRGDLKRG